MVYEILFDLQDDRTLLLDALEDLLSLTASAYGCQADRHPEYVRAKEIFDRINKKVLQGDT